MRSLVGGEKHLWGASGFESAAFTALL
ncbi:hypothetical protein MPC1_9320002 [Methylocella tundrae]|nr:hypothetical protein MPC1_9320002 [Methylocella tundrae]